MQGSKGHEARLRGLAIVINLLIILLGLVLCLAAVITSMLPN